MYLLQWKAPPVIAIEEVDTATSFQDSLSSRRENLISTSQPSATARNSKPIGGQRVSVFRVFAVSPYACRYIYFSHLKYSSSMFPRALPALVLIITPHMFASELKMQHSTGIRLSNMYIPIV